MNFPLKLILYILSNILGSFSHAIIVNFIVLTDIIDLQSLSLPNGANFLQWFSTPVMLCWLVCAAFGVAGFFIGGYWRLFFLLAPAFIPFLLGIALISSIV